MDDESKVRRLRLSDNVDKEEMGISDYLRNAQTFQLLQIIRGAA